MYNLFSARAASAVFICFFCFYPVCAAQNCWISPSGGGEKNGLSEENAYPASKAQECWDQTGSQGTMHVLQGIYEGDTFWSLVIKKENGGVAESPGLKRLKGSSKTVIRGSRPLPYKMSQAARGEVWIHVRADAGNIAIENFTVERVESGILADEGANKNLYFSDLHFKDTRQNIFLMGHPRCRSLASCPVTAAELSQNIVIQNTTGLRYSKRHIRLSRGLRYVDVLDSHADSAFLDGDFAVGFDVENPAHDILFFNSTARRNIYTKSKFWNGDGFKAEAETFNIKWISCYATENADGGFDIKTQGAYLEDVLSLANKRNIRTWSPEGSYLYNVEASYSKNYGGVGSDAGIWSAGKTECHYCTVRMNSIQALVEAGPKRAKVTFFDSVLAYDKTRQKLYVSEGGPVQFKNSKILSAKKDTKRIGEILSQSHRSNPADERALKNEKMIGNHPTALLDGSLYSRAAAREDPEI